ncbi:MAG TPA: hypothetical protein VGG54_26620 [Trebonia sp.]
MPRSANAASSGAEAAGDGGIGAPSGITSEISLASRRPRSTRKSCSISAVSLGAGGHLNGVEVTPMISRPPPKEFSTSRAAKAPSTV